MNTIKTLLLGTTSLLIGYSIGHSDNAPQNIVMPATVQFDQAAIAQLDTEFNNFEPTVKNNEQHAATQALGQIFDDEVIADTNTHYGAPRYIDKAKRASLFQSIEKTQPDVATVLRDLDVLYALQCGETASAYHLSKMVEISNTFSYMAAIASVTERDDGIYMQALSKYPIDCEAIKQAVPTDLCFYNGAAYSQYETIDITNESGLPLYMSCSIENNKSDWFVF